MSRKRRHTPPPGMSLVERAVMRRPLPEQERDQQIHNLRHCVEQVIAGTFDPIYWASLFDATNVIPAFEATHGPVRDTAGWREEHTQALHSAFVRRQSGDPTMTAREVALVEALAEDWAAVLSVISQAEWAHAIRHATWYSRRIVEQAKAGTCRSMVVVAHAVALGKPITAVRAA